MSKPLSKSEIAEGYDEIAEVLAMSPKFYRLCASLISSRIKDGAKVLDIGCGQGWQLAEIQKLNPKAQLSGLDLSPKLVNLAREHVPGADIQVGDADHLTYADSQFDVIVMTEVLEHLTDPVLALIQLKRVLKPSGWLLMTVPNRDWLRYDWYLNNRKAYQPVDDKWYRVAEVSDYLKKAGFNIHYITGAENCYFSGGLLGLIEKVALKMLPALQRRMKRAVYLVKRP